MKTYLDCLPCFMAQALRAARMATNDEKKIRRVLDETGLMFQNISFESTPPEIGRLVYEKVRRITENNDPYRALKHEGTQKALSLYPSLKQMVNESDDRLLTAIRIAVAGNVMDFGINRVFDLEEDIKEIMNKDFVFFDYQSFKNSLDESDEILYIGDNAGECVFDRVLIEELNRPVTYVVRGVPVINDALKDDAEQAGLDKITDIISSGTDAPGTVLETCSKEFMRIFNKAGFIISKGQGNFEALSGVKAPLFFLLKAKCPVIAKDLKIHEGDILLKRSDFFP